MKYIALIISFIFLLPSIAFSGSEWQKVTREDRELAMAEHTIIASLIIQTSPESRYLCAQNAYACIGKPDPYLALSLIAARNSISSLGVLANVLRYNMDGALSEDYDCYVLSKGKMIVPYLRKLKPEELRKKCENDFNQFLNRYEGLFNKANSAVVCSDPTEIKRRVTGLLDAISRSATCHPDDF